VFGTLDRAARPAKAASYRFVPPATIVPPVIVSGSTLVRDFSGMEMAALKAGPAAMAPLSWGSKKT
jgi:hypothetical protein